MGEVELRYNLNLKLISLPMSVEENIFLARVAEQAERFEDMVEFLKAVLDQKGADLTADERNLLSVAFKNLISSKRTAWRTISAIE
jgi:14-3-3 protein epsilon